MNSFKEMYDSDMHRYGPKGAQGYCRKFSYYLRKATFCRNKVLRVYYRKRFYKICCKHGVEISASAAIGKGLYIGHPYNITINPNAVLGENINIHKGVTIGQENRGVRKGVPTIGNQVWIGINSTIVGNITIGDDVLIAPNSYVNCDIPPHSVVIGNPCKIVHRDNATEHYINNPS
jgi:serine O-acetyltransferase